MHDDPHEAAEGVEAIVVLTEWPQFRSLDWKRLAGVAGTALVVDMRNLLDPDVLARAGFTCGHRSPGAGAGGGLIGRCMSPAVECGRANGCCTS